MVVGAGVGIAVVVGTGAMVVGGGALAQLTTAGPGMEYGRPPFVGWLLASYMLMTMPLVVGGEN